ncbi:MAG: D-TA family PLP-dependent enzyme [Candidatus Limiplasma sp.]|nr:D-TA family PLP-dependent enzyme [Candidatus Limiplasma sp.]
MKLETYQLKDASSIVSPALIYYLDIIEENVDKMARIAGGAERLWPHVKSHKSADLVRLLMQKGIRRFKCATIAEGEMVGECGADQAIISYPLVGPNIQRFVKLTQAFPGTEFFAIGDDEEQIRLLSDAAVQAGVRVQFLVDINDGLNRTGVPTKRAGDLYRKAAAMPGIAVRGMHVYDGHHHEPVLADRQHNVDSDVNDVYALRDTLRGEGLDCSIMVMGGTPSFPCHVKHQDVFLSPGTCLIQDAGYASTFPDLPFEVGAMLLTRVISHPAPGVFTVDLGYKGVAADPAIPRAVLLGYENAETVMQNEEHWVLRMPVGHEDERPAVGQELYAAPKHICPTSALYPSILVAHDKAIVAEWPVTARNRKLSI